MWVWLPLPLLFVMLALLLRSERHAPRNERQVKIWKPLSTLLVGLVALLSLADAYGDHDTAYTLLILVGLMFSLAGDVLLIPQDSPKTFLWGLVAFLLAHVIYIAAFAYLQVTLLLDRTMPGEFAVALVLALVGASIYSYLRPGLGKLRGPVIAYIVAISAMVHRAFSIGLVFSGPGPQAALVLIGALLFYISDAILAINLFRLAGRMPNYKLYNLSTYYSGQLCIALSTWFFL